MWNVGKVHATVLGEFIKFLSGEQGQSPSSRADLTLLTSHAERELVIAAFRPSLAEQLNAQTLIAKWILGT
jgi:hypothetical protein